jgi:hypothetical protein
MRTEKESYEEKGNFNGTDIEKLKLVKTLSAFANTKGGTVRLSNVTCNKELLDSARLDDLVNKYLAPRINGITSSELTTGVWEVTVPQSKNRPHIFTAEAGYKDLKGNSKSAFYPGQIYARHGSKSEPATADDLRSMVQDAVGHWFTKIGKSIQNASLKMSNSAGVLPVRIADDAELSIQISNPNEAYPYTNKTMAAIIGKDSNWVAHAAEVLKLKRDPTYCCEIKGASGKIAVRLYNEAALQKLKMKATDRKFNPYRKKMKIRRHR